VHHSFADRVPLARMNSIQRVGDVARDRKKFVSSSLLLL